MLRISRFGAGVGIVALFGLTLLPLFYTPGLPFPYVTGRAYLFRTLSVMAVAGWATAGLDHCEP